MTDKALNIFYYYLPNFEKFLVHFCDNFININSSKLKEGYLRSSAVYETSQNRPDECKFQLRGEENERIQLFFEDMNLGYPKDILKFNKIE